MATSNQYIGRREGIGIGIEATPGTSVAPQTWLRWLSQDIMNKTDIVENESAMGTVDKVNDSEVVAKYAQGKIGGKVTSEGIGFLMTGFFGSPSTGTAVSGIYPHTFVMSQSSIPAPALTIARANPVSPQRHSYAVIDSFELSAESGGWVQVESAVKARVGAASIETVAIVPETEFTSKHITVRIADLPANVDASNPLKASKVKLALSRDSEAFNPLGTDDQPEFDRGVFEAKGEFVVRYTDSSYETDYLANAIKAMSIYLSNGTVSVKFTANRVRFRELERSTDKDNVTTLTVSFYCELDTTSGNSIQAVLKNTRATYQAA